MAEYPRKLWGEYSMWQYNRPCGAIINGKNEPHPAFDNPRVSLDRPCSRFQAQLNNPLLSWQLLAVICFFYLAIGLLAPVFYHFQLAGIETIYRLGRSLCVQRPSRCFWYMQEHTALCSKCIGFYTIVLIFSLIIIFSNWELRQKKFGVIGGIVFTLMAGQSIWRAILSGYEAPVEINCLFGLIGGLGMCFFLRCFVFHGSNKINAWIARNSWFVIIALIAIHLFGFATTSAAQTQDHKEILVPAGTPVVLELEAGFSSKEVKEGDYVYLTVRMPVRVNKETVIHQGVPARALVEQVKAASSWGGEGSLTLNVRSVQAVDGSRVLLAGRVRRTGESSHGSSAAVAVGAGILCLPFALAGAAVTGEEGKIPSGFEIVTHTDGDHKVEILSEDEQVRILEEQKKRASELIKKQRLTLDSKREKEKQQDEELMDR